MLAPSYVWQKLSDNNWQLVQVDKPSKQKGSTSNDICPAKNNVSPPADTATEILHTVMPHDTLQGICLRYRVSAVEVRRLNLFSGNNIQFKKSLRIPIEYGAIHEFRQVETHEVLIQKFKNLTNELTEESRAYLEANDWCLEAAYSNWKSDSQFEISQKMDNNQNKNDIHGVEVSKCLPVDDEDEEYDGFVRPHAVRLETEMVEVSPCAVQLNPPNHSHPFQDFQEVTTSIATVVLETEQCTLETPLLYL
mmetsp:Transcript_2221/g.3032  ORF Transcript_2221/g.3032 Transcript_2221/m.3032 type:complete len:250 (+) Transcript_2221:144-893(+)